MNALSIAIGRRLAAFLSKPLPGYERLSQLPLTKIMATLQPGDIVLVDGNSRISSAIKYLTQSTWSHACLYVGATDDDPLANTLLEADLLNGVILVPLAKYRHYNIRICRPVGLSGDNKQAVIEFARARLGYVYDLRNIVDLGRYLIQNPAVPPRFRRDMIALGSGEPTQAICSTLIAEAYQSVGYPILPELIEVKDKAGETVSWQRHHTHYVPGDFDLSPYFSIIKPTIEQASKTAPDNPWCLLENY